MKHLLAILTTALLLFSSAAFAAPTKQSDTKSHPADSWQALKQPQQSDFYQTQNSNGGYKLFLPKAFGSNPLANLPHANGPMQLRATSEQLFCAINVQDKHDKLAFDASAPLPKLNNKQQLVQWKHGNSIVWNCTLSRQQDYIGDKLILEANAPANDKTYELLYVMPTKDYATLLSQAIWSLNSFELLEQK